MFVCLVIYLVIPWSYSAPEPRSAFLVESTHELFQFAKVDDSRQIDFPIYWPPNAAENSKNSKPLLNGRLFVSIGKLNGENVLNVRTELSRPESELDRDDWNRKLAFPEYDWMSRVRVWDYDKQWLWPNLPFLLRAHGIERQERYGGVDPGKQVDNDFAAVVLKSLSPFGNDELERVSAEWHGPPSDHPVGKRSIVHLAVSDDLQLKLGDQTKFGVWIIYADFLDSPAPRNWPEEQEFDGGILSYFAIDVRAGKNGSDSIVEVSNQPPTASTGVDWHKWRAEH